MTTGLNCLSTSFDISWCESRGDIDIQTWTVRSTDPVVGNNLSELPACQTEMEQQMELLNKNTALKLSFTHPAAGYNIFGVSLMLLPVLRTMIHGPVIQSDVL